MASDQFRTRVRAIMRVRGLTDADLAAKLDVKEQAVTKFLGINRPCGRSNRSLRRYAEALAVSFDYLTGQTNIEVEIHEVHTRRGRAPVTIR